jgi:hypothetical protein
MKQTDSSIIIVRNVCMLTSASIIRGFKVFYNRRYFLNFRRYLKIRLRAIRDPGGGSS